MTKAAPAARPPAQRIVPRWLPVTALSLCLLGLAISAYLTYDSFSGAALICPEGETFNCTKVTQSAWSKLFGIPVAPLGLLFFAGMALLCLPRFFLRPGRTFDWLRLAGATLGLVMVFYLVWAELFRIQAICLWCTGVHVVTFLLFIVLVFGQALIEPAPQRVRYKDRAR
ncbi:MAG: vitamin K epoxide reductase family protein [Dermatophilaceae bacterium]